MLLTTKFFSTKLYFGIFSLKKFLNWEWLPMEMEMVRAGWKKQEMEMVKQEMEMELVTNGNGVVNNYQWKW